MLRQRVVTAIVMLAILLPALFWGSPEPFAALTLLLIVAAGWEWARLNGCPERQARWAGAGLGLVLLALWWGVGLQADARWLWPLATVAWALLTPWLLYRGVDGWARVPRGLRLGLGWVLIAASWWALVQAHALGVAMLLSVLLLVWVADVAAYFGGRALGRHKLAPQISPGKSWEGAISGWLAVSALSLAAVVWWPSHMGPQLYHVLWSWPQPVWAVVALWWLVAMSVSGDLVESLVKRSAGIKDSSQLLPGHGGVLDRVDALLPVLPMAMWMVTGW
jgi:phosphatidate cytidylyltransferase